MQDLSRTLSEYDLELLRVIANRWDVDLKSRDAKQAAEQLCAAMLNKERCANTWDRLDDAQRGALQALLGSHGSRMPSAVFSRMYGEIRPMGPGKMEREKPYINPASLAEALYYRGLIGVTYGEAVKGTQAFTFVPTDLAPLLPVHKTGYKLEAQPEVTESVPQPKNIRAADTMIVDDVATLMAYCQLNDITLVNGGLDAEVQKALKTQLLGSNSAARLALMIAVVGGLGIASEIGGFIKPVSGVARKWLDAPRTVQVRTIAEAWRDSAFYNELAFTPGLKLEKTGWQNDPLLARQTVLTFLEMVPADGWWPIEMFISAVKEEEADFQRPGGDYDSWYIRDAQSNQYLRGFESWDKVDGAMLRFILTGILNGLGLVDTADNGSVCRLTAYGRAFTGVSDWPAQAEESTPFTIAADGLCEVPRSTSRYARFQLARFSDWVKAADPFQYRITAAGLAQAKRQNIESSNILTFLKRGTNDQVPQTVLSLIETWGTAGAEAAVISQMVVLRVPTAELLAQIQATPALRRYLGATLGPNAVAVRAGQWNDLVTALQANGVLVETEMEG